MSNLPDWLAALLASVIPGLSDDGQGAFSGYVEADFVYVAPATAGRIESLSVSEGDRVFEGQQLFAQDRSGQVAALHAAQARAAVAEANLENLKTGRRAQEIDVIRAELARAEAERDLASTNLDRSQRLLDRGTIAEAQADSDRATLASAQARVAELRAQLAVAELPARGAEQIAAEAAFEASRADVDAAQSAFDDRIVLAPSTGRIDDVYFEAGEVAGAGTPVLSILPDSGRRALFFIPEPRLSGFDIGDVLSLTCDGCANGYRAEITRIDATPQYTPPIIYSREERSRLVFRAEARISGGDALAPGLPITLSPER